MFELLFVLFVSTVAYISLRTATNATAREAAQAEFDREWHEQEALYHA